MIRTVKLNLLYSDYFTVFYPDFFLEHKLKPAARAFAHLHRIEINFSNIEYILGLINARDGHEEALIDHRFYDVGPSRRFRGYHSKVVQ